MRVTISNADGTPIYEQIVRQIKEQIVNGSLQEGEALPSMRLLAKDLRISVITTKRAYEELEREGFIITQTGRGSFVSSCNTELMQEEQLRKTEEYLRKAVDAAHLGGIGKAEFLEVAEALFEEEL